jgi:hypothetical protein
MDYSKVLKQAWDNVRHYRALWIFGVILALTTVSLESTVFYNLDHDDETDRQGITIVTQEGEGFFEAARRTVREELDELNTEIDETNRDIERFFARELDIEIESDILAVLTVLLGTLLIGFIVAKIASYVADTALIRMVNDTEETGVQHSVRQGLRLGWSRTALRFFLIDLIVDISAVLALLLLIALVFAPLALWATDSTPAGVGGTVLTVGLFFPGLALALVAGVALSMAKPFFRRSCALDDLGVVASIRRGFAIVRKYLTKVVPVGLIVFGVNLAWPLLVLPVVVVLAGVGLFLGGAAALLVGALVALGFNGATPWIAAAVVGIPVFILTLVLPLAFLGGLREVFLSSTWTLTYRELHARRSVEVGRISDLNAPGLEAAAVAQ